MSISENPLREAMAQTVSLDDKALQVTLADGRVVAVPLAWFPRLARGSPEERSNWSLIGRGEGIHWPDLDEDISVESLLAGRRSGETMESIQRWQHERSVQPLAREHESISSGIELIAPTMRGHSFITDPVAMFPQRSGGFALIGQREGQQAYTTDMPQLPSVSGFWQAIDLVDRLLLERYPNPLPEPPVHESPSGKRLSPREARKKRSGIAKEMAA